MIDLEKIEDIYIDHAHYAIIFAGITNIEFCNKPKLANFINGENTLKLIKLLNKNYKVLFPKYLRIPE